MTTPISRAAVLEILRTPAASDTFPDMIRRVEALEGCGVRAKALEWKLYPMSGSNTPKIWGASAGPFSYRCYFLFIDGREWWSPMARWVTSDYRPAEYPIAEEPLLTLEAAKAAAQADYTSRILAALEVDGND